MSNNIDIEELRLVHRKQKQDELNEKIRIFEDNKEKDNMLRERFLKESVVGIVYEIEDKILHYEAKRGYSLHLFGTSIIREFVLGVMAWNSIKIEHINKMSSRLEYLDKIVLENDIDVLINIDIEYEKEVSNEDWIAFKSYNLEKSWNDIMLNYGV